MRLWHEELIPYLPRQQLLGQHREACALRGLGWNKPHATVNYVFNYSYKRLYYYHYIVMQEMTRRGYKVSEEWFDPIYRGKKCKRIIKDLGINLKWLSLKKGNVYPEHDENYLNECLNNLIGKGIAIKMSDVI
jgi:uncharacterized protein (TIGR02328 family)